MRIGERLADQHADGARIAVVPVGGRQLMSERMPPADILVLAIDLARALQKGVAAQARRLLAQCQQLPHERRQPAAALRARSQSTQLISLSWQ